MTQEHPITPPPELVQQWIQGWYDAEVKNGGVVPHVATQAARWGADQELEACKRVILEQQWFAAPGFRLDQLHNARRPKPLSLKEQALGLLNEGPVSDLLDHEVDTIRRALEALPNV